ncbi:MAG: dTMP kinase [Stappiaceae bacterium]
MGGRPFVFDRPTQQARFITFEGGEGAGKSTQIARLADKLQSEGIASIITREPGGSPGAEAIRHVILSGAAESLGPDAEAMLFAAARSDHIEQTIKPALSRGKWVLCDRFVDSTQVYQGEGGADPRIVDALKLISIGSCMPDLTIIIDIPAEIGLERARKRQTAEHPGAPDRFEKEALSIHEGRRQAFLKLAADNPGRCVVVDGMQGIDGVEQQVWNVAKSLVHGPQTPGNI